MNNMAQIGAGFGTQRGTNGAAQRDSASQVKHLPVNSVLQSDWLHRFKKAVNTFCVGFARRFRAAQGYPNIDAYWHGAAANVAPAGRHA